MGSTVYDSLPIEKISKVPQDQPDKGPIKGIDKYKEGFCFATNKNCSLSCLRNSKICGFDNLEDGVNNAASKILNPDQAGGTGIYLGKIAATKAADPGLIDAIRALWIHTPFF